MDTTKHKTTADLVCDLREQGYAQCTLFEVEGDRGLSKFAENWARLSSTKRERESYQNGGRGGLLKPYQIRMRKPGDPFKPNDLVFQFALRKSVLDVAEDFLGECRLKAVNVWLTLQNRIGAERTWSQSWHRDPGAERQLKVFVFFDEVMLETGALQYIPATRPDCALASLSGEPGTYPGDDVIRDAVDEGDVVTFNVDRGTVLFIDTSGLHRGGWCVDGDRLCANINYMPIADVGKPEFVINSEKDLRGLISDRQRNMLTGGLQETVGL